MAEDGEELVWWPTSASELDVELVQFLSDVRHIGAECKETMDAAVYDSWEKARWMARGGGDV